MSKHPVVTKDFPENMNGGIMVCGIDFGFSQHDEMVEHEEISSIPEEKSFFSDSSVRSSDKFRRNILKWLDLWGVTLATVAGKEGAAEREYFQTNWLDSQNRSNLGANDLLVQGRKGFLELLSERKPRVIFFSGATLIEALNDIRIREEVEEVLGSRSGNATVHTRSAPVGKTAFKVLVQHWPKATVISTPHATGAFGVADGYMEQFGDLVRPLLKRPSINSER